MVIQYSIGKFWFLKWPDWLPTKADRVQYRNEELWYLRDEFPKIVKEFTQDRKEYDELMEKFVKSLNEEQYKIFI